MNKRAYLNKLLNKLAQTYPPEYKVKLMATEHFVERFIERHDENFENSVVNLVNCIENNICLVIYYIHSNIALPERGRIDMGKYQIRGDVYDDTYTLTTFVKT